MDSGAGNCLPARIGPLVAGTAVAGRAWLTAAGAAGTTSAARPAAAATGRARGPRSAGSGRSCGRPGRAPPPGPGTRRREPFYRRSLTWPLLWGCPATAAIMRPPGRAEPLSPAGRLGFPPTARNFYPIEPHMSRDLLHARRFWRETSAAEVCGCLCLGVRIAVSAGRRRCAGSLQGPDTVSITAFQAPLAQLAEQQTLNLRVRGSSPWRRTHPYLVLCGLGCLRGGRPGAMFAAWREACGWSLKEAAARVSAHSGEVGLDPGAIAAPCKRVPAVLRYRRGRPGKASHRGCSAAMERSGMVSSWTS